MRAPQICTAATLALALVVASCGSDDGTNGEATAVVGAEDTDTTLADADAGGDAGGDDGSGDSADGSADGSADDSGDGDAGGDASGGDDADAADGLTDGDTASGSDADGDDADSGSGELPGDPFDIGPQPGVVLDVVGVRYDDSLNFREGPGVSFPIVDDVKSLAASPEILSAGEGRLLSSSAWWRVTVGGTDAWASFRFLGVLGQTDDILGDVDSEIAALEAASADELIDGIAEVRGGGGGPALRVTQVQEPAGLAGGRTAYVVDVLDFGDDALAGERLTITIEESGGGFSLVGLERTLICNRGVSDGLCL